MNVIQEGTICLIKSAITGAAVVLPEQFSLEQSYEMAAKQGFIPLLYEGAIRCGVPKDGALMQKMRLQTYKHMLISEQQMREVARLLETFDQQGIDHMPVKGCNMKALYPKPELRSMGDADILIRQEQLPRCGEIMRSLGYKLSQESDHTDNWQSEKLYVELHKSLVPKEDGEYYAYYGSGWRIGVKGEAHRYDPTPEDTFVFLFTHFARHYRAGGIGCRHVADLYVYRNAHPQLDERYIRRELKKLHLDVFYGHILRLLQVWFHRQETDEITELITAVIFSGGSWGSLEASLYARQMRVAREKGTSKGASFRAVCDTLFPPLAILQSRYQILRRFPVLLPLMWVVRWFDVLLFSRRNLRRKMAFLRNAGEKELLTHQQTLNAVGLDFYAE